MHAIRATRVATPGWGHETARHWRIRHRNGSRVIELEEILLPYFATAISARHGGELRGAFQTYCNVAEFGEDLKVASRAAAKIEYSERPFTLDVLQDRCDVLADVMIASAFPEILGMPVVELQRHVGDFVQVL